MNRLFGLVIGALVVPVAAFGADRISVESRLVLVRELTSATAVAKLALPRGKHGFFLGSDGKVDEENNEIEFRNRGRALNPGTPIQITKVRFKGNRIIFDINGGGKTGGKWYHRIRVSSGSGTMSQPIRSKESHAAASGAFVSLVFVGSIPDLTLAEVKKLLDPVLDFERRSPTTLYSPRIPEKYKEAIRNREILVGMNRDAVLSSKGAPDCRIREFRGGIEYEEWIYGVPPNTIFVTFDGDIVTKVKIYFAPKDPAAQPVDESIESSAAGEESPPDPSQSFLNNLVVPQAFLVQVRGILPWAGFDPGRKHLS